MLSQKRRTDFDRHADDHGSAGSNQTVKVADRLLQVVVETMLEYFHAGHDAVGVVVSGIAKLAHGCERDCTRKPPAAILDLGNIRARANRIGKNIRYLGPQPPLPPSLTDNPFPFSTFTHLPPHPDT